mmetsp:Transcript_19772/g.42970  ORF Transcript_19772/g.42970 Transcript_19772/m.42970 type:complete len:152 (-) Transcript_19772:748-1203(-)
MAWYRGGEPTSLGENENPLQSMRGRGACFMHLNQRSKYLLLAKSAKAQTLMQATANAQPFQLSQPSAAYLIGCTCTQAHHPLPSHDLGGARMLIAPSLSRLLLSSFSSPYASTGCTGFHATQSVEPCLRLVLCSISPPLSPITSTSPSSVE